MAATSSNSHIHLAALHSPLSYIAAFPRYTHLFGITTSRLIRKANCIKASVSGNMTQASTVDKESAFEWLKKDNRRMLHAYKCLGMKLLRKRDIPEEKYTNAFLGYGPEDSHFVVELTYIKRHGLFLHDYGVDKYDIGTGFGHFGIAVEDVSNTVDLIKAKGGNVTREPGPVKGGRTVIAFIEDPDGYKFELLERGPTPEPLCQVMLCVGDLDRSIEVLFFFFTCNKAFGMELLRKRDNPEYKIAIGTDDVYKTAEAIKLHGGTIPVSTTKITACLDPNGWKTVFVDNVDFVKELE
ncbi:hypothetical protein OPV22_032742 [Ensete ventricosum]|uniref:lactoylglutathione lyase n=1 Tax=Ensete ventricosum TaxID=4639 RepID=A0AAV8P2K8_ENSVE|nr:hypothetical protein OPV22_032742 [Ensete ventricosum]